MGIGSDGLLADAPEHGAHVDCGEVPVRSDTADSLRPGRKRAQPPAFKAKDDILADAQPVGQHSPLQSQCLAQLAEKLTDGFVGPCRALVDRQQLYTAAPGAGP